MLYAQRIGKLLREVCWVLKRVFSRGVLSFVRDRKVAREYWRRIVIAALYSTDGAPGKAFGLPRIEVESIGLPSIDIEQIIPEFHSIPITLIDWNYVCGDVLFHELIMLCRILRYRCPQTIFEIGTFIGETTFQMAANTDSEILTLDLPPIHSGEGNQLEKKRELEFYPDKAGRRFHSCPYIKRIHQLFGDSQSFNFKPYENKMDVVFVDGCHHYEFALSDSKNALSMLSENGIIIWHDYSPALPGVMRALKELGATLPLMHLSGSSFVIYDKT